VGVEKKLLKKLINIYGGHNRTPFTKETRQKLRDANLGITLEMRHGKEKSDEIKKKIGETSKGRIPWSKGKTWEETYGKEKADELRKTIGDKHKINPIFKNRTGKNNPYYKGHKDSLFSHFSSKIKEDENRENKNGKIEVKCSYCGKWFVPSPIELDNRIGAVKRNNGIGGNFYCSNECKELCPDFYQVLWPKNYKPYDSINNVIEVDPNLRKLVFERDDWKCQKCNSTTSLECHHIDPVALEPLFANDIDSCITFCKECHKWTHMNIDGCGYNQIREEKQKRNQGC